MLLLCASALWRVSSLGYDRNFSYLQLLPNKLRSTAIPLCDFSSKFEKDGDDLFPSEFISTELHNLLPRDLGGPVFSIMIIIQEFGAFLVFGTELY